MNKLIETAKELDRILESGIEILPNSPIHEKLKQALNIDDVNDLVCLNLLCSAQVDNKCLLNSEYSTCFGKQTER